MKARIPNQGGNSQAAMMKKIQDMQNEMARIQEEVENSEFSASAGGGAVQATVSGKNRVTAIKIAPEAVDLDDVEMLEDLILSAVREALAKAEKTSSEQMGKLTGGMNIPGLF